MCSYALCAVSFLLFPNWIKCVRPSTTIIAGIKINCAIIPGIEFNTAPEINALIPKDLPLKSINIVITILPDSIAMIKLR